MNPATIEGYRLSPQQKKLWQLQHLPDVNAYLYLSQCVILIEGALNAERLKQSIHQVVTRHNIFQTTFESLQGLDIPLQVIGQRKRDFHWSHVNTTVKEEDLPEHWMKSEAEQVLGQLGHTELRALLVPADELHYLILSMPALYADSITLHNLFKEIAKYYILDILLPTKGETEEPVQFLHFSEWQLQLLEEVEREQTESRELIQQELHSTLRLPFESRMPVDTVSFPASTINFEIDTDITNSIKTLCLQHNISVDVLLFTCWHILLWKLTGEPDISIYNEFDGRKFQELQGACGLFATYAPIALHCSKGLKFTETLQKMSRMVQERRSQNGAVTVHNVRTPSIEPTTNENLSVGFSYQEWPAIVASGNIKFSLQECYKRFERLNVELISILDGDVLKLVFHFDPRFYEAFAKQKIGEAYLALLIDAIDSPATIGELNILSDVERHQVLFAWNETETDDLLDCCLHELFEAAVKRSPKAIAVEFEQKRVSFDELNMQANQLAHYLRARGIGPESKVGLLMNRSCEMIVAILGVLKAGGAYLPIDSASPTERILQLLQDVHPGLIITEPKLQLQLLNYCGEFLCLADASGLLERESSENPDYLTLPENLAYIIPTSGSTGIPKGVMIEHRSVVNLLHALDRKLYDCECIPYTLRVSVNAPIIFDASVKQLIQLVNGRTLCLIPEKTRSNGEELLALIEELRIDVLDCTPSQLKMLVEAGLISRNLSHPMIVLVGGEALDQSLWTQLAQGSTSYYNVYGPTECTVDSTLCRVGSGLETPSIGGPLANVKIYLLDEELTPVLSGVPGEIYIAGEGLARGYLSQPSLTADKFIPNSFSRIPGERLYRTGDFARCLTYGNFEFLGRYDGQVKLRGTRIEVGEIEATLKQHPAVSDACVILREDQQGNSRLVGYAVPKQRNALAANGHTRYVLPNGLSIVHQNRTDTTYLYQEIFEDLVYFKHGITLPDQACVFDVGANIGLFTLFISQNCSEAKIYAFEPLAPIFHLLQINTKYSGIRARLFPYGLSITEKSETFTYYPSYPSRSGISAYADANDEVRVIKSFLSNKQAAGEVEIGLMIEEADDLFVGYFNGEQLEGHVRKLSEVLREEKIERIDLLKIDVQRAELDVLKGIDDEDWGKIWQIVMEVHDGNNQQTEGRVNEILSLLKAHDFHALAEQDPLLKNTDRYTIYARRNDISAYNGAEAVNSFAVKALNTSLQLKATVDNNAELSSRILHEYLKSKLPEYMVPVDFVILDSFPLTRNAKIDRKALPVPEEEPGESEWQSPKTPFEELLSVIWSDVLGIKQVRSNDNFFERGGHSLLATRMISRVRESFNIELPLRSVFEVPTLGELARRIVKAKQADVLNQHVAIQPASRGGGLPLSFAQERLWFLHQFDPRSFLYNCPCTFRLTGQVCIATMGRALGEVIRRHEVLRTTFPEIEGQIVQFVQKPQSISLPITDLSTFSDSERESRASELCITEAQQSFDLQNGPLLRAQVLKLSPQDHLFLLTVHHIVFDGWSLSILVREIAILYDAYLKEENNSPLQELPVQYGDYAVWQRAYLNEGVLDQQLEYWESQLSGVNTALELPLDRQRPPVQSHHGASQRIIFSDELIEKVRDLCRAADVTPFMFFLAAFKVLLYRYSGQSDIIVGTDIAGRDRRETENLIGFFINQLPLRTEIQVEESFRKLLGRERAICIEAYAHQDTPFEKVVEYLKPPRSLSYSPLFQISFAFNNLPRESVQVSGLEMRRVEATSCVAKFDLTFSMVDGGSQIVGAFEYNIDLFDTTTIARMMRHFQNLLHAIVSSPEHQLSRITLLDEQERQQILVDWNQTTMQHSHEICLHELFEASARRTPDAPAVICGLEVVSFGELNKCADSLAAYLIECGITVEDCVGLLFGRSKEMLVGILGVLKAGAAYVPLDADYPPSRLQWMLEDARVTLLLTRESLVEKVRQVCNRFRIKVIETDKQSSEIQAVGLIEPERKAQVKAENSAYIIYTSGSTGSPKAAVITHKALVNYTLAMVQELPLTPADRILQLASPSFDVLIEEVFPTWVSGAAVVVMESEDNDNVLGVDDLTQLIDTYQVTGCELPVPLWHEWSMSLTEENFPASLKWIIAGCEKPLPTHLAAWKRFNRPLIIVFGLTETSITSTLHRYFDISTSEENLERVSIGRPIANTQIYILDSYFNFVLTRIVGELYIGGAGLARNYHDRPDNTAIRFIPHPFSDNPGERLYRTGDLARYFDDGRIEFLGRADHQVKIRGFRIELAEIEKVLTDYQEVREGSVIAHSFSDIDTRLIAYLVSHPTETLDISKLRAYLAEKLPGYMIPSFFIILDSLPVTSNGKLDRKALPVPKSLRNDKEGEYVSPSTQTEIELAQLWSVILKVEQLGIYDNFFDAGGHSLLAMQLISRIRKFFSVELPLRAVFEFPTIVHMAKSIDTLRTANQIADQDVSEILESLENLSEEQVRALLDEKLGEPFATKDLL